MFAQITAPSDASVSRVSNRDELKAELCKLIDSVPAHELTLVCLLSSNVEDLDEDMIKVQFCDDNRVHDVPSATLDLLTTAIGDATMDEEDEDGDDEDEDDAPGHTREW